MNDSFKDVKINWKILLNFNISSSLDKIILFFPSKKQMNILKIYFENSNNSSLFLKEFNFEINNFVKLFYNKKI